MIFTRNIKVGKLTKTKYHHSVATHTVYYIYNNPRDRLSGLELYTDGLTLNIHLSNTCYTCLNAGIMSDYADKDLLSELDLQNVTRTWPTFTE